jgi:hypothetical protein
MKSIFVLLPVFLIACAPKTEVVQEAITPTTPDSVARPVETVAAPVQVVSEERQPFSWDFTPNLSGPAMFTVYTYDSMKNLLDSLGIETKEAYLSEMTGDLKFDESSITFTVWEDGSQSLCAAVLSKPGFPLAKGLRIGMPMKECLEILNLVEADLTGNSQTGEGEFSYQWVNGGGDYGSMLFTFDVDNTILREFVYTAPCVHRY